MLSAEIQKDNLATSAGTFRNLSASSFHRVCEKLFSCKKKDVLNPTTEIPQIFTV